MVNVSDDHPKCTCIFFFVYRVLTFANVRFWFFHRCNWSICFSFWITVVKTGGDVLMNTVSTVLAFLAGVGTLVGDRHGSPNLWFLDQACWFSGSEFFVRAGFWLLHQAPLFFGNSAILNIPHNENVNH